MAEPFLTNLNSLVTRPGKLDIGRVSLETKHFFSGAALYANGKICAFLNPAGFAIKLPAPDKERLFNEGRGQPFRFFPGGPIKKEYVFLSGSILADNEELEPLLTASIRYAARCP
jgi:TfoX/Sxy family transcriptional regulator of competence genes